MVIEFYKDYNSNYPKIRLQQRIEEVNHTIYKYLLTLAIAHETGVKHVYPACLDFERTSKYVYRVREYLKSIRTPDIIGNNRQGYYYLKNVDKVIIPPEVYNYPTMMRCPTCNQRRMTNREHKCSQELVTNNIQT